MGFGGFDQNASNAPMSEINTTPLVDVMLVLLIIFIITAPLITNTVTVNLPSTNSTASPEKPDVINLSLDAVGRIFWNDKQIDEKDLPARFAEAAKGKSEPELHLRADKDTRYQKITEIMTEAQKAGIHKLGFLSKADGK